MPDRLLRYLLSTGNLVGCAAALVVVGLFLADVIGSNWPWIAAGAYLAGALPFLAATPKAPKAPPETIAALLDLLDGLQRDALPRLPPEARPQLSALLARLCELMLRLQELEGRGRLDPAARAQFRNLVVRLLPETLEAYLRLPEGYARSARLADGRTPLAHLAEQLDALQRHAAALEEALMSPYANQLLVNTRFLKDKAGDGADLPGRGER